ncbi:MAG: ribosome maturation factor RimP [Deferrisomatales bacterium]|nr:ribosome maturation factor RimP [Deferrisomatales bacterium]
MERAKTIQAIEAVLQPAVEGLGYELVAVQLRPEGGRLVLRLLVDRPGGITLKECAGISREVGPHLDVADLIPSRYSLEVSSPGIQRPLVRPQDYQRFRDARIVLRTRGPVDGRKTFRGVNRGLDEEGRVVVDDRDSGCRHAIPLDKVREAHLDPEIQF